MAALLFCACAISAVCPHEPQVQIKVHSLTTKGEYRSNIWLHRLASKQIALWYGAVKGARD
jgi:hypothetical protein